MDRDCFTITILQQSIDRNCKIGKCDRADGSLRKANLRAIFAFDRIAQHNQSIAFKLTIKLTIQYSEIFAVA